MSDYQYAHIPATGNPITYAEGVIEVPDLPIIPFVEGDGIGPDIWRATRHVVDSAVQKAYNVNVASVNIVKTPGKRKRYGPRLVKRPDTKKAIVTLKSGERIQLFEGA